MEEFFGKVFLGSFVAELVPDTVQYPSPVMQHPHNMAVAFSWLVWYH